MAKSIRSVWALWPTIEEMASDLDDSVNALRRDRDQGRLPDPKHDKVIALKARSMGRRITLGDLARLRSLRPLVTLEERREAIGRFYENAGGVRAVSQRTGVSEAHLYSNRSRGWLNMTRRLEYRRLAEEIGFDLPDEIFSRPEGT